MNMKSAKRTGFLLACILPSLILYIVFVLYQSISVFANSAYNWSGLSADKEFVGFKNFITLFHDDKVWQALKNTVFLIIFVTIVTMCLSLALAYALTRTKLREKNLYRTLFFFPNVLSIVVIGALFEQIYSPNTGILNSGLEKLGLSGLKHMWLGDPKTVLWAIGFAMIWQAFGYYMVIYLAGMDSISPELYEVAEIEGASKIYQFFKVTLPLMWEIIRVSIILFINSNISLSFTMVTVMTDGAPNGSSEVLLSYMYRQGFGNANYGYAMAIAVFIFLFSFGLALVASWMTKNRSEE